MGNSKGSGIETWSKNHCGKGSLNPSLPVKPDSDLPFKNAQEGKEAVLRIFDGSKVVSRSGWAGGLSPDLYTCISSELKWQVEGKRCSCRSSWCPYCWGVWGKVDPMKRLKALDNRRVRHLILSTDRELFIDGEDCWDQISSKRGIGNLLKELERSEGIQIRGWVGFVEWYKDGFPHWHVFIEVEEQGFKGMIGRDRVKRHWPFGVWIIEKPIMGEQHWRNIVGYFDKHGYFEAGKGYQSRLPAWALKSKRRIRRWGCKRETKKGLRAEKAEILEEPLVGDKFNGECVGTDGGFGESCDHEIYGEKEVESECRKAVRALDGVREKRSYEVILSRCGMSVYLKIRRNEDCREKQIDDPYALGVVLGDLGWGIEEKKKFDLSYDVVKTLWNWSYEKGKGLVARFDEIGLLEFLHVLRTALGSVEAANVEYQEGGAECVRATPP